MKNFYGASLPATNPELNHEDKTIINMSMNDSTAKTHRYIPDKDGIFVVGCSYMQGSYAFITDETVTDGVRFVACSNGSGNVGQSNGVCRAYKSHEYSCNSVRGQWIFVPYK